MNQMTVLLVYVCVGLLGQYLHFLKKKWVDQEICCSLLGYILNYRVRTYMAVSATMAGEIGLALSGGDLALASLYAAWLHGYACDGLNKGSVSQEHG